MEQIKTFLLLGSLSVLLVLIGGYFGGTGGMAIALLIAGGMNFYAYYFSDAMILKHYNAQEVDPREAPMLYRVVERLVERANLPMPKVYIIHDHIPNAFATGRNPEHAAVAITTGLLELLSEDEIEGVMAHELSHVEHRDILVATIAATIAGAIAFAANIMQFGAMFGNRNNRGGNPILMIAMAILLPIAASIIQMTISRSREFMADEGAARLTGHPEWLQNALIKLSNYNGRGEVHGATPENAHMFIISPFDGKKISFANLFRTHPTTEQRLERLEALKEELNSSTEQNKLYDRHYV
ncbi:MULTISPECIES: zinc metalloprotease HtpX [unclassified Sulfuricurvum]|uniref:zinc metalloprotease HtpX n=1 Tax=unclassified Sulfuricurvum TaxID=2632390 RepID=UPI00029962EF|nr:MULTISPECIES: zinc metalloprotease HtpX [unclassified Sulfuricurvum]AFV97430.1 M48 family peptidase [Candidatus Sulfuricurvum sp. RIFRC-1]OHD80758.1 MAG: protease [Sulfuricurvum sp. RIFCSPHIGHO2_02_FULL_43_9]HBM35124.1 zinc metalloprotease HtpX [Sulfuricurvum sp.]